jgi:hypothetical protein
MVNNGRDPSVPQGSFFNGAFGLRGHVLVALEHVQPEEREGVLAAAAGFARGEIEGIRLPGADPVFRLQAAPDLLMFVRRHPDMPIEALDIVRPATLRLFANAAAEG